MVDTQRRQLRKQFRCPSTTNQPTFVKQIASHAKRISNAFHKLWRKLLNFSNAQVQNVFEIAFKGWASSSLSWRGYSRAQIHGTSDSYVSAETDR